MKKLMPFLLALGLTAPLTAAQPDTKAPQLPNIDAGSIINQIEHEHPLPLPAPTTLDTCSFAGSAAGTCSFKCESGATLNRPPETGGKCAEYIIQPVKPAAFRGTRADLNWKNITLKAADGTRIVLDYAPSFYDGNATAQPLRVTVSDPRFNGSEHVRAVVMTYYTNSYMAGKLKDTRQLDLPYNGQAFQAKTEGVSIMETLHTGYGYNCDFRQEIAIVVDGQWLTDPVSGSHNFGFKLDWSYPYSD